MANEGLIPHGAARLPGKEWQPQPEEGECVLLATHVDRGFSLPPSIFFRAFLNFFGAQLHHFTPNSIAYLAAFVSMCESFLGCRPHWGLFKHIFTCRSQTVKKASPGDEKTRVVQMCGGSGDPGEEQEHLPSHDISRVSQRLAVDLVLLPGSVDAGAVEWTPSVHHGPSEQALLSEGDSGGES